MSIFDKVIKALKQAGQHNSSIMVKPEVILWPDPESQWAEVISDLQVVLPHLLVYGKYDPAKKQGPAIWLKCMVARTLPEAIWEEGAIPVIYLPGVAKTDLRNVEKAGLEFQPLLEYQYTGTIFTQENGKEWTILAFVENSVNGLGLQVAKDGATKYALKQALPTIFQDSEVFTGKSVIDSEYINSQLLPDIIPSVLKWMCKGDAFLQNMEEGKRTVFTSLCKTQYDFEPDHKNIKAIAEKLGSQRNSWKQVWQMYANAPGKYPEIEDLLRLAKPVDLGSGMFALPSESWPQINEQQEDELYKGLEKASKLHPKEALGVLNTLEQSHKERRNWIWFELGQSPLADALQYLAKMAEKAIETFPSTSIEELKNYYTTNGFQVDQAMRKSLAAVKSEKDKALIKSLIQCIYKPWLESITNKFQKLIEKDTSPFTGQVTNTETEEFVLFVDALRFELAEEFCNRMLNKKYKVSLNANWSAIPSLTPTAKPNASPIANLVSTTSDIKEFRPQLQSGKDLQTEAFRDALAESGFKFISSSSGISPANKCWHEIGEIDTKGHEEQSGLVKRVEELFEQVQEVLDVAFEKGIKRIKIVTDHGWLLLPGGLPKTQLNEGLTETRWGRCALIKEGAKIDLLHLPWRWNPSIFIAYAPGISFFKANQEYAHGGISLHECLVPTIIIENSNVSASVAKITEIKWVNLKCAINTEGANDGFTIDIRTKYNDSASTIVESRNKSLKDNKGSLMVSDEAESQAATIVLLDETGRIIDKKSTTVGE
ncbi:MAG: BREX-1 system phosphatase PglZ type B [Prolixibacteraceae bacterium]|nr:BREX-1 system phosphatase PglZ type B [Prolixibacteraceae bacterium]